MKVHLKQSILLSCFYVFLFSSSLTYAGSQYLNLKNDIEEPSYVDENKKEVLSLLLNNLNDDLTNLEKKIQTHEITKFSKDSINFLYKKIKKRTKALIELTGREDLKLSLLKPEIETKIHVDRWTKGVERALLVDYPEELALLTLGLYPLIYGTSKALATAAQGCSIVVTAGQDCSFTGVQRTYLINSSDWKSLVKDIKRSIDQIAEKNGIEIKTSQ